MLRMTIPEPFVKGLNERITQGTESCSHVNKVAAFRIDIGDVAGPKLCRRIAIGCMAFEVARGRPSSSNG